MFKHNRIYSVNNDSTQPFKKKQTEMLSVKISKQAYDLKHN